MAVINLLSSDKDREKKILKEKKLKNIQDEFIRNKKIEDGKNQSTKNTEIQSETIKQEESIFDPITIKETTNSIKENIEIVVNNIKVKKHIKEIYDNNGWVRLIFRSKIPYSGLQKNSLVKKAIWTEENYNDLKNYQCDLMYEIERIKQEELQKKHPDWMIKGKKD